jgi:ABC-2 type transport system permease protein
VALHVSAAVALWCGTKITGAPLQLSDSLAGALNSVPVALLAVGTAAVGVGWIPWATIAIGALPVVAGFGVNLVIQSTKAPHWVANLSPMSHLAAVPDAPPNCMATAAFLLVGAILAGVGVVGYVRRDLAT